MGTYITQVTIWFKIQFLNAHEMESMHQIKLVSGKEQSNRPQTHEQPSRFVSYAFGQPQLFSVVAPHLLVFPLSLQVMAWKISRQFFKK